MDPSLAKCVDAVVEKEKIDRCNVAYYWDDGVLMRKWSPTEVTGQWSTTHQLVIPDSYRSHILALAHDHVLSGHLGITKTYERILRYFFWPGLKSDVRDYCRSCSVCQIAGKPNQNIAPAPLHPIPTIGEPFERIILDCVGPLPKSKSGHQYLLTIMCAATRFPEAIPLRTINAKVVTKALVKFFSSFGLPRFIQTDQGTNFMSKVFLQVRKLLTIEHKFSSAWHPESQGALERFHQTLKSMLRTYCLETGKEWDDGIPLLLFAIRETVQESLGFSPADLIFAHTVRGPLRLLREELLCESCVPTSVLDYVSEFRERLQHACKFAQAQMGSVQAKMKERFDEKSVRRAFSAGDEVLVLLPVVGSALQARFTGPYVVDSKLSETNYVIRLEMGKAHR